MKLVPFLLKQKESTHVNTYILQLFLTEGGKELWEIGSMSSADEIQEEFLKPNDFHCESIEIVDNIAYAKLDPTQMKLSSFYTWDEIQCENQKKKEDCFRTFIVCEEKSTGKDWFPSEVLQTPFEKTTLSPSALFQGLKNLYYK
jgi:hypothetical protein